MATSKRKAGQVPPQSNFSRIPAFDPNSLDVGGKAGKCAISGRAQTTRGQAHARDDFILRGPAVARGDRGFIDIKPSVLRAEALLHTDLVEPGDTKDEEIEDLQAEIRILMARLTGYRNLVSELVDSMEDA